VTAAPDGPGGHHGHHGHHGDHGAHHADHGAHGNSGDQVSQVQLGVQSVPGHHTVHGNVQRPVSASFSIQPEETRSSGVTQQVNQPSPPVVKSSQITQNLADLVATHPKLTTLRAAVEKAGLQATLSSPGPFTVFAPTDLAFKKIPDSELNNLLDDKDRLTALILRHIVPGPALKGKHIPPGTTSMKTAEGSQISTTRDKFIQVKSPKGSAYVVLFDVTAGNGVLHAVDTVI